MTGSCCGKIILSTEGMVNMTGVLMYTRKVHDDFSPVAIPYFFAELKPLIQDLKVLFVYFCLRSNRVQDVTASV